MFSKKLFCLLILSIILGGCKSDKEEIGSVTKSPKEIETDTDTIDDGSPDTDLEDFYILNKDFNLMENGNLEFTLGFSNEDVVFEITELPTNGSLIFLNNKYIYTPYQNYNGLDSIHLKATMGDITKEEVVSLSVLEVNNPPVSQSQSILIEDIEPIQLIATDVDSQNLVYTIVSGQEHVLSIENGLLNLKNFSGTIEVSFQTSDGNTNSNVATITATRVVIEELDGFSNTILTVFKGNQKTLILADMNHSIEVINGPSRGSFSTENGQITYVPLSNFEGSDNIEYRVIEKSTGKKTQLLDLEIAVIDENDGSQRFWPQNLFPIEIRSNNLSSNQLLRNSTLDVFDRWDRALGFDTINLNENRVEESFMGPQDYDFKSDIYFQYDETQFGSNALVLLGETQIDTSSNQMYDGAADILVNFSSNIPWNVLDHSSQSYIYGSLLIHELGHFLGFDHVSSYQDTDSIMKSTLNVDELRLKFSLYDVQKARQRYNSGNLVETRAEFDQINQ